MLPSTVATVKVAIVAPAAMVTVWSPSSVAATKSRGLAASATDRFTVRSAVGATSAVMVKVADEPSVTAAPPEMATTGPGPTSNTGDRT